jgi:hypothetical protein
MKKLLGTGLLALPLLALPTQAQASFNIAGCQVDAGAKVWFNVRSYPGGNGPGVAGPWYLYWPYAATPFAAPPPISACYPRMMTLPPGFGQPPLGMPAAHAYGAPGQDYQPPMPTPVPGQDYRPPMPTPVPGNQAPLVPQVPTMYRPPLPAGVPHPAVYSYYAR